MRRGGAMRGLGLVVLTAVAALLAACGGRPGPLRAFPDGGTGVPADAAVPPDSGVDARGDGPLPRDSAPQQDASSPCVFIVEEMAVELLTYGTKSVYSPSLVTVEAGDAASPARVAVQAIVTDGEAEHPYNVLTRIAVGSAWLYDTVIETTPQPCGTESHSYAQLTPAPGGRNELALAWLGDPGGQTTVLFRAIDLAAFTCGTTVTVSSTGSTPWGLVAGAGVGAGGQGYAGDGYGILWEEITQDGNESLRQPVVVVLDPAGGVVQEPVPVAAAVPYPQFEERTPSIAWSGSAYLLATAFDQCASDDPLCAGISVVVTRLRPEGGDSRLEIAATIPVSETGNVPQRPAIAHDDRGTLMVWVEGPRDATPFAIRGVALAADGSLLGAVQHVATGAQPIGGVRLAATEVARAAIWPEDGDPTLPDEAPGRSRIIVQHVDDGAGPRGDPVLFESTRFSSHNVTPTVAIQSPRGLLHSWSARGREGYGEAAFIGLVRCEPAE